MSVDSFPGTRCLIVPAFVLLSLCDLQSAEKKKEPGMLERILNPDRNVRSRYEGQVFQPGGSHVGKRFQTGDYEGVKPFTTKSYSTRSYGEGSARQSWLGSILFPSKKLPENFQGSNPDATKTYATKSIPGKSFADASKKSTLSGTEAYPIRAVDMKGKSQGAIDSDQKLQEAVKKGLSIEDVRNLLNKAH